MIEILKKFDRKDTSVVDHGLKPVWSIQRQ